MLMICEIVNHCDCRMHSVLEIKQLIIISVLGSKYSVKMFFFSTFIQINYNIDNNNKSNFFPVVHVEVAAFICFNEAN